MDHCCSGLKQSGFAPPSGLLAMPSTGWTYFRMQRSGEPGKCHSSLWARAEQERMGVGLITHSQWLPLDLTPQERAPGAGGSHADSNQTVQGLRHIGSLGTSLVSRNIPASSPEPVKFMSSKMPPPPPILLYSLGTYSVYNWRPNGILKFPWNTNHYSREFNKGTIINIFKAFTSLKVGENLHLLSFLH